MILKSAKTLCLLTVFAGISACTVIPEPTETRVYPLHASAQLEPVTTTYQGNLRISQPSALQALDVPRLSVIRADGRQAYWQDIRLQDRLPLVVQASLVQALSDAQVAEHVLMNTSGAAYDVDLHSTIERFAIREGEQWQAQVSIRFQLLQGSDRRVVDSRQLSATQDLAGRDINSALAALSAANTQLQRELAAWLASELN